MRTRVAIVVTIYALAAAFTVVAYRLYLPQSTLITDRVTGPRSTRTPCSCREVL